MSRTLHRLTALTVKSLPPGKYNDGDGLWLVKRKDGGSQWVLRVVVHGRRREMGLGSANTVPLKQARVSAAAYRSQARSGVDPIARRSRDSLLASARDNRFHAITADAFLAKKSELKDDGKAGRWLSPLHTHVLPKIGMMPVEEIDQNVLRTVLGPIWHSKADVARKALNRINIVLRYAAAKGLDVDLSATAKTQALLGKSSHTPIHIASIPWREVPEFYRSLNELTVSHLALRLLILTGLRSFPIRQCSLDQIRGNVWTIPGAAMKGPKGKTADFRVPLSTEAINVIDLATPHRRGGYLFASRNDKPISDMTLSMLMKRRGLDARPHGFRSSLRVWMAEETDTPNDVAETALAHAVGSQVSRSYQRSDLLEQRRVLLERWANFVTSGTAIMS